MAIKFHVIPLAEIFKNCGALPADNLAKYLESRPGILDQDKCDIFCRNSRSEGQRWQRFGLFDQVDKPGPGVVTVCPFILELYQAYGMAEYIQRVINYVMATYSGPVVFQWNHDIDSAEKWEFDSLLCERCLLLDFNTSKLRPWSLALPFWTIRTDVDGAPNRSVRAGFAGHIGSVPVRVAMRNGLAGKPGFHIADGRVSQDGYIKLMRHIRFALCPRGGGLNSYRTYEAIQCEAIPVIFADDCILPGEHYFNWPKFSIRLPEKMAGDADAISAAMDAFDDRAGIKALRAIRPLMSLAGVQQWVHDRLELMV